jgi:hypothetical protein
MFSPTGLYVCGALLLTILVAARFLPRRRAVGLFLVAAAVTAFESGLLTDFGLPLPSGLMLVLAGLRSQLFAALAILVINVGLAWAAFRLLAGHGHGAHPQFL